MKLRIIVIGLMALSLASCAFNTDEPTPEAPKVTEKKVSTELFNAVLQNDYDNIRNLIAQGANLDLYDNEGYTVLMRAVELRNPVSVGILLAAGARIYQPSSSSEPTTALILAEVSGEQRVIQLIEENRLKLVETTKSMIAAHKFADASKHLRDNFIPIESNDKAGISLPSFTFQNIGTDGKSGIEFIKTITADSNVLKSHLIEMDALATKIKSTDLLIYLIGSGHYNSTNGISLLKAEDAADISWLAIKIGILNSKKLDYGSSLKSAISAIGPYGNQSQALVGNLVKQISSAAPASELSANEAVQNIIVALESQGEQNEALVRWIPSVISSWQAGQMQRSKYSYDEHVARLVKTAETNSNVGIASVVAAIEALEKFSASSATAMKVGFESALNSSLNQDQKMELLRVLLTKVTRLPEKLLGLALRKGGEPALQLILDSSLPFVADEQADVASAVIEVTKSGDSAKAFLVRLRDKGITFANYGGRDALNLVLQKIWNGSDETYVSAAEFIIGTAPGITKFYVPKEFQDLLMTHFQYVRKAKKNWNILTPLVQEYAPSWEYDYISVSPILLADKSLSPRMSLAWSFILSMYEVYTVSPVEIENMLALLGQLNAKFNTSAFSMSFSVDDGINHFQYMITERPLVLASLFSLSKENILSPLQKTYAGFDRRVQGLQKEKVNWNAFVEGDVFLYYSTRPKYWERVAKVLLENGQGFGELNDQSALDLVSILTSSDLLYSIPFFAQKLGEVTIMDGARHYKCAFDAGYESGSPFELITLEIPVGPGSQIEKVEITKRDFGALGIMTPLLPLRNKSCGQQLNLGNQEARFVKTYLQRIASGLMSTDYPAKVFPANGFGHVTSTDQLCSKVLLLDFRKTAQRFDPVGASPNTALTDLQAPLITVDAASDKQMCSDYEYNGLAQERAERWFLETWYQCAIDNNDEDLMEAFKDLQAVLPFEAKADPQPNGICF